MFDTRFRFRNFSLEALLAAVVALGLAPVAGADSPSTLAEVLRNRNVGNTQVRQMSLDGAQAESSAKEPAQTWGIEVSSIRLTAHNHMIDYRYRVLDADKAADLFKRQIKPQLIHQDTGRVLVVPDTAKIGPLRNSNIPQNHRIYWMFFGNAGNLVKTGDKVTLVIGDLVIEDLVVE